MSLVLRQEKASALTNEELDGNFVFLDEQINQLRSDLTNVTDTTLVDLQASIESDLELKQPANTKLTSLSGASTSGIVTLAGNTITPRTIDSGSASIVVTNGDGVAGNPTIDVSADVLTTSNTKILTNKSISGLTNTITNVSLTSSVVGTLPYARGGTNATTSSEARTNLNALIVPAGTGIVVKTGTDQTAVRQIQVSGVGLSISNGPGVSGNPVVASNGTSSNTPSTLVARDSSGNFTAGTITATLVGNASSANTVSNGLYSTGSYSNPTWLTSLAGSKVTSIPNTSLQNSSVTINGVEISLGESVTLPEDYLPVTTQNTPSTIVARDASGNFRAGRMFGNVTGNVIGNVTGNLSGSTVGTHIGNVTGDVTGNVTGNVTGTSSGNVPLAGGTMTGFLTLAANPTNALHATTKQYVDTREYTFTHGNTTYSTTGFTNQVGSWNNGANFFDVFPPAGKVMGNLVAFIPSIAVIHFAGGVNGDDSIRCTWVSLGDRIRVYVQNTEQRSTPAANWLAIWR